jgi:hypothetical protein
MRSHARLITLFYSVVFLQFFSPLFAWAASNTITYTYDSLGRLTFLQDPLNGNRDYDYDYAGNRLQVKVGTASDASSEPAGLLPPSNRSCYSVAPNVFGASWSAAPGASYYNVKTTAGAIKRVTGLYVSIDGDQKPCDWIQSCDINDVCSATANF